MCSLINLHSRVRKWYILFSLVSSHPKKMIIWPIFNNKDEVIQVVNFKPRSLKIETPIIFLIYELIMLSISWVKNDICWNCITCVTCHTKDFWFLSNHTHNHWNTYSSFFNVGMMVSSTKKFVQKSIIFKCCWVYCCLHNHKCK